jgi:choline dehydrogenase-like flavoprotein
MRVRELDGIDVQARPWLSAPGWPIEYAELSRWYTAAATLCGLQPVPAVVKAAPRADFLGAGLEVTMCRFADPLTFRRLGMALLESDDVTAVLRGTVLDLRLDGDGKVGDALVATVSGSHFRVRARAFVLACGGIETPRLLLNTSIGRPGGAANPHGQVGRNFLEHLHVDPGSHIRLTPALRESLGTFTRQQTPQVEPLLRFDDATQRREGLANAVIHLRHVPSERQGAVARAMADLRWGLENRTAPSDTRGRLRAMARDPRAVGRVLLRTARRRSPIYDSMGLVLASEQLPNARSRVTLARRRDRFGQHQAALDWRLGASDIEGLRRTLDLLNQRFEAAGLPSAGDWGAGGFEPRIDGSFHAVGTMRMGDDPRSSVVTRDCRVHGFENLWIAGSSVMPTAGAVTVTFTAVALALRLAGRISEELAGRG